MLESVVMFLRVREEVVGWEHAVEVEFNNGICFAGQSMTSVHFGRSAHE